MVELLAGIFVKDMNALDDARKRSAYGYVCGGMGIVINLFLFAGKFLAGTLSGSVAITADAFNNLSDAGSSIISILGFKLASQKPDPKHPFGHGRYEYLASLLISAMIMIMGFELGKESIGKILHPEAVDYSVVTFVVLGVSIAAKLYMYLYNSRTGEKIGAATLKATAADSVSDAISTGAVMVSAVISAVSGWNIDGFAGLAVTCFILYAGISSAKETVSELLGGTPDEEFVQELEEIVLAHDLVSGIHDLIAHSYGPGNMYVSLHAEVPGDGDIMEIHDEIDNIEREVAEKLGCLVTIHMDPVDMGEDTLAVKAAVGEVLAEIDEKILFHDFRMVKGPTHTNVIFDVVVPMGYGIEDEELKFLIGKKIYEKMPSTYAVITVDKDFAGYIK